MTTLADLERVERELRGVDDQSLSCARCDWWADTIAAYVAAQRERDAAERDNLLFIANARRFDRTVFADDTEFADWAQSRARFALAMDALPKEPKP
jgi:hypothetical protein